MRIIRKFNEMASHISEVIIEFPNGDKFSVPAAYIATARTEYYSTMDDFEKGSPEWDSEYETSMSDDNILDWIQNNMDWSDIESVAERLHQDVVDYDDMFSRAKFNLR